MNHSNTDLARAMVAERLAAADQRRLVNEVKRARRTNRAQHPERSPGRWLRHLLRVRSGPLSDSPSASRPGLRGLVGEHSPATLRDPATELRGVLDRLSDQIVEHGTRSAAPALTVISSALRHVSPGAAAAVVDWEGSEVARLRGFGVLHGVALDALDPADQRLLLGRIHGPDPAIDLPIAG